MKCEYQMQCDLILIYTYLLTRSSSQKHQFSGNNNSVVTSACFSSQVNSSLILGTFTDSTARLWQSKSSTALHTLLGHTSKVNAGIFALSDDVVVTGSADRTVKVWDTTKGLNWIIIMQELLDHVLRSLVHADNSFHVDVDAFLCFFKLHSLDFI
jgi:WD40 repeat protein